MNVRMHVPGDGRRLFDLRHVPGRLNHMHWKLRAGRMARGDDNILRAPDELRRGAAIAGSLSPKSVSFWAPSRNAA